MPCRGERDRSLQVLWARGSCSHQRHILVVEVVELQLIGCLGEDPIEQGRPARPNELQRCHETGCRAAALDDEVDRASLRRRCGGGARRGCPGAREPGRDLPLALAAGHPKHARAAVRKQLCVELPGEAEPDDGGDAPWPNSDEIVRPDHRGQHL